MKFGKIENEDIERLPADAFRLPVDDPADTVRTLERHAGAWERPAVRAGGTMWNIRAWRGKVFPAGAPQRVWPECYGRAFDTIEYNATHYRIYAPDKMRAWADAMPDDFRFCPKMPAIVSHYRRFANCEGPTDDFIEGLLALGEKLGPTFIQLPPHFAPKHAGALQAYLAVWPRELPLAVEFRHPDWFTGGVEAEAVWQQMHDLKIGAVISDTAGRRDAVHMRLTAPFLLLRFGGYEGHPSDEFRLREWADRIARWAETGGLREVHLLVHQPDSIRTPETCAQFLNICRDKPFASFRQGFQAAAHAEPASGQTRLF